MKGMNNMKTTKKILALLVAAMLLVSLLPTALADEGTTYTITINTDVVGHTYQAYQIFTGDYSNGKLSNIKWGTGITADGQTALQNSYDNAETKLSLIHI